jgi:GntR family transcriptional regulator, transcriptional repressor for pyruvate dehydrogenase complex
MLNSIKAVEKKRAYEDVVTQIRMLIENGKVKRGDQLPTERELSETFRVSRATVREAIRTLESMKLVQSRQGDGTYVLSSSEETLVQPLAAALFHEQDDIHDIFFIRKIIEPYVAQLAAENATNEEIKILTDIVTAHEDAIASGRSCTEFDSAFHAHLARMTKNRVLERLLSALVDLLEKTRDEYLQNEERAKKSFIGHHAIFTAVKNGDCTAARAAMTRHLKEVMAIVIGKRRKGG